MARHLDVYGNYYRIDWIKVLYAIKDGDLFRRYFSFKSKHPGMSINRCAYYVIKKRFSTTALQGFIECCKKQLSGVALVFFSNEIKHGVRS